jgi:hypothetical protein
VRWRWGGNTSQESRAPTVQDAGNDELNTVGDAAEPGDDESNTIGDGEEPGDGESTTIGDAAEPGDDESNTIGDGEEPGDDESTTIGDGTGPGNDEQDTDADGIENSAPSISGIPRTSVVQDSAYEFVPSASDPDGDALIFNASNKPDWTSFNPITGVLAGTPTAANVRTTDGIVISVTDGMSLASLPPFSITVNAAGPASVTLSWTIPSTNEDGTPLTDLAGFRIYYGTVMGIYSDPTVIYNPGISTLVIDNLSFGSTYFFVATAFDETGNESEFSNEISIAP